MWTGGTPQQRQAVAQVLRESTYPWRRFDHWPLHVTFYTIPTTPRGNAGGLAFPDWEPGLIRAAAQHELGHVLDGRLLTWESRRLFTDRYGGRQWYQNHTAGVFWGDSGAENFAEAYQAVFQRGEVIRGAGWPIPETDTGWFRQWILGMDGTDIVWI